MSTIVVLAGTHILFALGATLLAARSGLYPRKRLFLQGALALLVPVLGPAVVLFMWSESKSEAPKPSTNEWVRLESGEG